MTKLKRIGICVTLQGISVRMKAVKDRCTRRIFRNTKKNANLRLNDAKSVILLKNHRTKSTTVFNQ